MLWDQNLGTNLGLVSSPGVRGRSGDETNLVDDSGHITSYSCLCWNFPVQANMTVAAEKWVPQ